MPRPLLTEQLKKGAQKAKTAVAEVFGFGRARVYPHNQEADNQEIDKARQEAGLLTFRLMQLYKKLEINIKSIQQEGDNLLNDQDLLAVNMSALVKANERKEIVKGLLSEGLEFTNISEYKVNNEYKDEVKEWKERALNAVGNSSGMSNSLSGIEFSANVEAIQMELGAEREKKMEELESKLKSALGDGWKELYQTSAQPLTEEQKNKLEECRQMKDLYHKLKEMGDTDFDVWDKELADHMRTQLGYDSITSVELYIALSDMKRAGIYKDKDHAIDTIAYLDKIEVAAHIGKFFNEGAHCFITQRTEKILEKFQSWGRKGDGNFVGTIEQADKVLKKALLKEDPIEAVGEGIGFPPGAFKEQCPDGWFWRVMIPDPLKLGFSMVNGTEESAFKGEWRAGGQTLGGLCEGFIDSMELKDLDIHISNQVIKTCKVKLKGKQPGEWKWETEWVSITTDLTVNY